MMINRIFCDLIKKIILGDKFLRNELSSFKSWTPITIILYIISEFQEFPESCKQDTLMFLKSITKMIKNDHDYEIQEVYKLAVDNLSKKKAVVQKIIIGKKVGKVLELINKLPTKEFENLLKELEKKYSLIIKKDEAKEIIEDNSIKGLLEKIKDRKRSTLENFGVRRDETESFISYLQNKLNGASL
jgi:hypothetical protein